MMMNTYTEIKLIKRPSSATITADLFEGMKLIVILLVAISY